MAQTTLISSIKRSVYYPTEYILSSPYRCGTFSLIVDTGTWTEQMYYELPCLQLDIYTTISGVDVKYLSCNITLDTDNPMEPYTVSLYEVPETFKVKLTPGFDNDAVTSHKALCNQLNIPNTWVEETTDFNCELIWDNDNIKSGGGGTVDEVARSSIATHTSRTDNPHTVTKAQVGLSDVVNVDTTTTSNIIDSADKRFVSDAQKAVLDNTSGSNSGDETTTTIITKIGYTPENTVNKDASNGYCGLDSGGKVPLQNLPSTLLKYIGTWNAETNTPSLTATDLTKVSHVYVVSHSGTQFGIIWKAGDWLIYDADGLVDKSDNSDDVVSVNGKTGIVIINKADVGLSNVDNTSDLDKPISTLTQTALNLKANDLALTTHTTNTSNPHGVTKSQVGLSNVVNVNTTTTANITDSTNKRFITDAQKTILDNTTASYVLNEKSKLNSIKKSIIGENVKTILTTDWVGSVAPYTVIVPISIVDYTITSNNDINISPIYSSTLEVAKLQMEGYSYISEGKISSDDTITLTCYDFKPNVNLDINIEILTDYENSNIPTLNTSTYEERTINKYDYLNPEMCAVFGLSGTTLTSTGFNCVVIPCKNSSQYTICRTKCAQVLCVCESVENPIAGGSVNILLGNLTTPNYESTNTVTTTNGNFLIIFYFSNSMANGYTDLEIRKGITIINSQYGTAWLPYKINKSDKLYGKFIAAIGDSYTKGNSLADHQTWLAKIGCRNGMTYYNKGKNGDMIAWNGVNHPDGTTITRRFDVEMPAYADIVIVFGGHNDATMAIPIGENTDTTDATFKGALNVLINKAITKYPKALIIFITPSYRYGAEIAYSNAMQEIALLNNIIYINTWTDFNFTLKNASQKVKYDERYVGLYDKYGANKNHFSEEGHERMSYIIEQKIRNNIIL